MDTFITNESALEFWRLHRRSKKKRVFRPSSKIPPLKSPAYTKLRYGTAWGLTLPLDIMVSTRSARRPSAAVRPHVCSRSLPDGAFAKADSGLYVSSPEFCFLQMAGEYPLAKIITLGTELCGSYSMPSNTLTTEDQDACEQPTYNIPELTNIRKLKAFVSRMKWWPGYRQAIKALRYVAEDSASPMETVLLIFLTLPYRYGGYGLPKPEMNGRIYPEKGAKKFSGRDFYRGDLLWRKAGVVAEYNSDLEHASPDRIAKDAIRRSDLELCGIREVTVTKSQIKNLELLHIVAKQIAKRLGRQLRNKEPGFSKAQRELLSVLL